MNWNAILYWYNYSTNKNKKIMISNDSFTKKFYELFLQNLTREEIAEKLNINLLDIDKLLEDRLLYGSKSFDFNEKISVLTMPIEEFLREKWQQEWAEKVIAFGLYVYNYGSPEKLYVWEYLIHEGLMTGKSSDIRLDCYGERTAHYLQKVFEGYGMFVESAVRFNEDELNILRQAKKWLL